MQYAKGVAACEQKQAEAQASYWEQRAERTALEGKAALKQEKAVATVINEKVVYRTREVEKSAELEKNSKHPACGWDADELRDLTETIREANK